MRTLLEARLQSIYPKRATILDLHTPTKTKADLFSNDFLSLASNATLRSRFLDRLATEPDDILGSTGSRLLDGNTQTHVSFEARLRDYYNGEASLLFNSGYDANLALFGTLAGKDDIFVYDELIHASIFVGMRSSRASKSLYPFAHNSATSLRSVLQNLMASSNRVRTGSCTVFVALESIYSMDGDVAPLSRLVEAVEQILPEGCAQICVDEAHSAGLYGPSGRGIVSYMGLEKRVNIRLYTFSKALASSGAVVICSPSVRTYLINFSPPFIYTTSLARSCVIAAELSLDVVRSTVGDQLRERLFALIAYTKDLLRKKFAFIPSSLLRVPGLKNMELQTAIIPIFTPYAVSLSLRLRSRGWATIPIPFPTVPRGEERIRFIVHAGNTEQEIREFVRDILDCVSKEDWKRDMEPGFPFDDPTQLKLVSKL